MGSNVTGDAAGPARLLRNYFEKSFLKTLDAELLVGDLMVQKTLPANSGLTIEFRRINKFNLQLTGITQDFGSAHSTISGLLKGETFVVDSIVASLDLVGNDLQISELALMTAEPNPISELQSHFFRNGVETLEQRYCNRLVSSGGTNGSTANGTVPSVTYAGGSASVSVVWGDGSATLTEATLDGDNPVHNIAAETFNKAYTNLRSDKVRFHPRIGRYAAFVTPGVAGNLRLDSTFQEMVKGTQRGVDKFEMAALGDVFGCKVMESPYLATTVGTIDATNDEIHRCIVFGEEYAGRVSHASGMGRPRVAFVPPAPSAADPYGNNGYLTWKAYMAVQVLNPLAGEVVKVATLNKKSVASPDDVAIDS